MTDDTLPQRVEVSRRDLEQLMRRGRQLRDAPQVDAVRSWQVDCAGLVRRLSGGTHPNLKAHWLARAYSEAFLVRRGDGGIRVEALATEIIDRILAVLRRADESLSRIDGAAAPLAETNVPSVPRFDFVHDAELRSVLEQAFVDSARAFETSDFASALMTSCVILEAIITDALRARARQGGDTALGIVSNDADAGIGSWSFATRIAAAEKAGLIRGGCARLPLTARTYRDEAPSAGSDADGHGRATVSERDARVTRQVLLVIMRDLDQAGR